jgi:S1-C subfamily serine protease
VTVGYVDVAPIVPHDRSRAVTASGGLTARQIYEADAPGVVFVNASGVTQAESASEYVNGEGGQEGTATGSGFEIDGRGTILTNWHVVEDAAKVTVSFDGGKSVQAQVIGKDPSSDIALLRVPTDGVTVNPLALGDSGAAHVGDSVLAIGNPFGLGGTLTTGVFRRSGARSPPPTV